MDEIAIIGGYVTISGALAVLRQEGVKVHRRTVLRWLERNNIGLTKIGQTLVFPQFVLSQLIGDYAAQ